MAVANAALYAFNHAAGGTIFASSQVGEYIDDNLLDSQPGKIWRSADTADIIINGDFGSAESVSAFAFINHNLTATQTVQLDLAADDQFIDILYTVSWPAVTATLGWGEGPWGDDPNVGGYPPNAWSQTHLIKTFTAVEPRYWKVTITGLATHTDGYAQAGNLFLGAPFQPVINVQRTPSISVEDPTQLFETRGQSLRAQSKNPYRTMECGWFGLTMAEALEFREMCRAVGRRSTMLVSLWPGDDTSRETENQFLARLVDWDGPTKIPAASDYFQVSVTIREAI